MGAGEHHVVLLSPDLADREWVVNNADIVGPLTECHQFNEVMKRLAGYPPVIAGRPLPDSNTAARIGFTSARAHQQQCASCKIPGRVRQVPFGKVQFLKQLYNIVVLKFNS